MSLAKQFITERNLFPLFDQSPEKCVVLLEDMDSAGLTKRDIKDNDSGQNSLALKQDPSQSTINTTTRALLSGQLECH